MYSCEIREKTVLAKVERERESQVRSLHSYTQTPHARIYTVTYKCAAIETSSCIHLPRSLYQISRDGSSKYRSNSDSSGRQNEPTHCTPVCRCRSNWLAREEATIMLRPRHSIVSEELAGRLKLAGLPTRTAANSDLISILNKAAKSEPIGERFYCAAFVRRWLNI